MFGTRKVQRKRQDIHFTDIFTPEWHAPWSNEIDQLLFAGSMQMQECVFFHKPSGVLIVTDLIENFRPDSFSPVKRILAKLTGILAPNGKMPLDWRLSFMFGKAKARAHLETILGWQPQIIIMAHGVIVSSDAGTFLRRSFSWLNLRKTDAK